MINIEKILNEQIDNYEFSKEFRKLQSKIIKFEDKFRESLTKEQDKMYLELDKMIHHERVLAENRALHFCLDFFASLYKFDK